MIIAELKNGAYRDSYSIDITFPVDEESMMEQLSGINISDRTMKDLINLTFNLHNYTVVTDFSDLKRIGRKHYLDKNIGCLASEMEKHDFETMGRNLLKSGDGKVTPYGVVFCNQLPIISRKYMTEKCFPITITPATMH